MNVQHGRVSAAAGLSVRPRAGGTGAGTGRLGPRVVRRTRAPVVYAREAGKRRNGRRVGERSTACDFTAVCCAGDSSRRRPTARSWRRSARARSRAGGAEALARGKARRIFFPGSVRLGGGGALDHDDRRASLRVGRGRDGGAAALQPGVSGWDIAEQSRLLELFQGAGNFPGNLEALESGALRPKKSLLAVFGLTRQTEMSRGSRKWWRARTVRCPRASSGG